MRAIGQSWDIPTGSSSLQSLLWLMAVLYIDIVSKQQALRRQSVVLLAGARPAACSTRAATVWQYLSSLLNRPPVVDCNLVFASQVVNGMFAATTGKIDDRWRQFMGFQISRTRQIFADAEAGVDQLAPDARLPVWCDCFSTPRAHPLYRLVTRLRQNTWYLTPCSEII